MIPPPGQKLQRYGISWRRVSMATLMPRGMYRASDMRTAFLPRTNENLLRPFSPPERMGQGSQECWTAPAPQSSRCVYMTITWYAQQQLHFFEHENDEPKTQGATTNHQLQQHRCKFVRTCLIRAGGGGRTAVHCCHTSVTSESQQARLRRSHYHNENANYSGAAGLSHGNYHLSSPTSGGLPFEERARAIPFGTAPVGVPVDLLCSRRRMRIASS